MFFIILIDNTKWGAPIRDVSTKFCAKISVRCQKAKVSVWDKNDPVLRKCVFDCALHARSDEVAMKLLRSCNEVATKLDPIRSPCDSPASPQPSIQESTKGGGRRKRPPPFVEAARSAASFMDGCGEAGEAQGILHGSNFVATSLQLRSDFVAVSSDLACKGQKRLLGDATQLIWSKVGQSLNLVKKS